MKQSLIDPISATDLQKAVVEVLPLWATPILEQRGSSGSADIIPSSPALFAACFIRSSVVL